MTSNSGLRGEFGRALTLKAIDLVAFFVHRALPWLVIAAALYLFRDILYRLTSGDTGSEIWINLMSNVSRTRAFAFIFGGFGILYGLRQRHLREKSTTTLCNRIAELEDRVRTAHHAR